ncbi:hypothetical protein D3C71_2145870 [compost metagenome]
MFGLNGSTSSTRSTASASRRMPSVRATGDSISTDATIAARRGSTVDSGMARLQNIRHGTNSIPPSVAGAAHSLNDLMGS